MYNHYTTCRNKDDYTTYNNDDDENMHSQLVSTSPPPRLHVWASHVKVISSIRRFGHVRCRAEHRGWGGVEGHEGGDLQGVMVVELMRSLGVAVGPDAGGTDGS